MSELFDDDTLWTFPGSREIPGFVRDEMRRMMRDFVNSLPVDDPARLLWATLPEPPGWSILRHTPDEGEAHVR
jgi:hypothetical protein